MNGGCASSCTGKVVRPEAFRVEKEDWRAYFRSDERHGMNRALTTPPAVVFLPGHLLVAVDFSPCSAGASRAAVRFAQSLGVPLSFVHVLAPVAEDPEVVLNWGDYPERRRAAAEARLQRWSAELAGGLAVRTVVLEGRPCACLLEQVQATPAPLLFIGRRGCSSGLDGERLGGIALRLLRHVDCPVWVADEDEPAVDEPQKALLLATDYSPAAEVAVPAAAALAGRWAVRLIVANVQEALALPGQREYARHEIEIEAERTRAAVKLEAWRADRLGALADCVAEPLEGTPARALCRAAARLQAGLIVLASRGWTNWLQALLGGTAERVAEHAPCAVLIIPVPVETAFE